MHTLKKQLKENKIYILAFFLPILLLAFVYNIRNIFPFGNQNFLYSDMYAQYAPFFREFTRKLASGESLQYSWNIGLGSNFSAIYAYYLSSPLNFIFRFVKTSMIIDVMNLLIIFKIALASFTFVYYLRHRFHTKNMLLPLMGIFYAMSSYVVAFMCNIMWLDCVALLPLIILGLERLIQKNTPLLYCISLSICIISNYYLSIILCIFCVIYFLFTYLLQENKNKKCIFQFIGYSAIAGGIAAFLILPSIIALTESISGNMSFPWKPEKYFPTVRLLFRSLMNVPALSVGNSKKYYYDPNVYCTIAVFFFVPLYAMNKTISFKERVSKILLLLFFWISFNLNILNYIWHGFHFPIAFPSRQSFIYIFLILIMMYEGMISLRHIDKRKFFWILGCNLVLLFYLEERFTGNGHFSSYIIYGSLIYMVCYFFIILSYLKNGFRNKKGFLQLAYILCISEVLVNWCFTSLNVTPRAAYVNDNQAIEELIASSKNDSDTLFYRINKSNSRTHNDSSWDGYKGTSLFSSMALQGCLDYKSMLGFVSTHDVMSYTDIGSTPFTEALFSVKYKIGINNEDNNLYTKIDQKVYPSIIPFADETQKDSVFLFKNLYTFPVGFLVDKEINEKWNTSSTNSFAVQNSFLKASYKGKAIFEKMKTTTDNHRLLIPVKEDSDLYFKVKTKSHEKIAYFTISIYDSSNNLVSKKKLNNLKYDYLYPYILHIGEVKAGQTVAITANKIVSAKTYLDEKYNTEKEKLKAKKPKSTPTKQAIQAYVYRFNLNNFKDACTHFNQQGLQVTKVDSTTLEGTITAQEDSLLYTSIGYEKGWHAYVDGKEITPSSIKNAMLSIPISKGTHQVTLQYRTPGLTAGIVISGIFLCILILCILLRIRKRKRESPLSKH